MAQTEVKRFLEETQRQIDEDGLLSMSGTDFKNGDKPIRVLKAKQYEHRIYSGGMVGIMNPKNRKGKFASIALIARDLNNMFEAIKNDDLEPFTFDDSTKFKDDVETYMDDTELEVTKGCNGCCDFKVCWPDQAAIDRSVAANKVMNRVFAQSRRKEYADAQMKKYFWKDDAVERVLQLEREGKTRPYHDY